MQMHFIFKGLEYRIKFAYVDPCNKKEAKRFSKLTHAKIEFKATGGEWDFCCGGSAECGLADNFCKERGRVIALTRALEAEPRDFRAAAWHSYRSRFSPTAKFMPLAQAGEI
jgi:hypothetical protein